MKSIKTLFTYIAVLAAAGLSLLATACEDDDAVVVEDGILRIMTATVNNQPLKGGVSNLPVDVAVALQFTHELETEEVLSALTVSGAQGEVPFTAAFENTNSLVLLSNEAPLDFETTYTLTLPAGTYGSKGETLETALAYTFTTEKFTPPQVRLEVDVNELSEGNEATTLRALLDKEAEGDVTVILTTGGSATPEEDYVLSATELVIPAGSLEATATVTTRSDDQREEDETILISIAEVINAEAAEGADVEILIRERALPLSLKGIMAMTWDGSGTNDGKAIHLVANENIADLSTYGLGVANNGGGTDGQEYTFPAIAVAAGDHILVARSPELLGAYFEGCMSEFDHVLTATTAISQNGDDAIELFSDGAVIETYGDADVSGAGQPWDYTGSWAYKREGTWIYGGVNCTIGATTNATSGCKYPLCEPAVELKGVLAMLWETSGTNGGKAVHLKVLKDVDDLSVYGLGTANNGGGTDGLEYTLPAISAKEGDDILIARETATLAAYFGNCMNEFEIILDATTAINQNGDDAIELFLGTEVIETYGNANVDGTGQTWEYTDTWAYKMNGIWTTGAIGCSATANTTQASACPYPECD